MGRTNVIANTRRPRRNAEELAKIISGYVASGLSVFAFCKKHHLNISVFHHYHSRIKLDRCKQAPSFVPVVSHRPSTPIIEASNHNINTLNSSTSIHLVFPNGIQMHASTLSLELLQNLASLKTGV